MEDACRSAALRLEEAGILPVICVPDAASAAPLAQALIDGGLGLIEVTLRNPAALDCISEIRKTHPDMLIGAGTVMEAEQARKAVEAGAEFLVCPGMDEEVVRYALEAQVLVIPGCVTPTEVRAALRYGLKLLKFFPAEQMGGLKTIRDLSGPFSGVRFIPTCGMTLGNIGDYLASDKVAAVGGSFMAPSALVRDKDWAAITELSRQCVRKSLAFSLAHVGVNSPGAERGSELALAFAELFDQPVKDGQRSTFGGPWVEFAKCQFPGRAGHIAVSTASIARARAYLEKKGVRFRDDFLHTDKNGRVDAIYLEREFGDFAVHLIEKRAD